MTTTTTEYTAPLSNLISRIVDRLSPPTEKAAAPIAFPTPTMEVISEIHAGQLTASHVGKAISLGDGCRGEIKSVARRFDAQSGRTVTEVTTDRGLRSYGPDRVLLLVQLRRRPVPSAVRTPAQPEYDAFKTAEYASEEATRLSLIPQQQPRVLQGYFAGLNV